MSAQQTLSCAAPERVFTGESRADTSAIIVAGGTGERFGDARGKQFVELCGLPLASWSIAAYDRCPSVAELVVVCAKDRREHMLSEVIAPLTLTKPITFAEAGEVRQASVYAGLSASSPACAFVAIHDAARPLIEMQAIEAIIGYVRANQDVAGAIAAARVTDTLKTVQGQTISSTPDRALYWAAQTPQVFRREVIYEAHACAQTMQEAATDDALLVERAGKRVDVFECEHTNIKVTYPEDLSYAEAILQERLLS